jgi:hypothetical protein
VHGTTTAWEASPVAVLCVLAHRARRAHARRSAGKKQEFEGVEYTIEELTEDR